MFSTFPAHAQSARSTTNPKDRACRTTARLFTALVAAMLLAQSARIDGQSETRLSDRQSFYFGVNVLSAGVSALVQSFFTDAKPLPALLGGMTGGAITYGGQRIVGTGEPHLRLVGMQTVALGANIARNSGQGVGPLEDLTFPIYPFYLRLQTHDSTQARLSLRLSAVNVVSTAVLALGDEDRKLSWSESLRAGGPVLEDPDAQVVCKQYYGNQCITMVNGRHVGGATVYATGREGAQTTLVHEMGHHAQFVRDAVLHAVPASDFALRPLGKLSRYLVIDGVLPFSAAAILTGTMRDNFYEKEADAMMGRSLCDHRNLVCAW